MENNIQTLVFIPLVAASATLFCPAAQAQAPVVVKVYAVHTGENIQYHYQVINQTRTRDISSVSLGNRGEQSDDATTKINEQPELSIYPTESYWGLPSEFGDDRGYSQRLGGIFTAPYGWDMSILGYSNGWPDISPKFSIELDEVAQNDHSIPPGQTFNFSVTIPKNSVIDRNPNIVYGRHNSELYLAKLYPLGDPAYLNGHFTVRFLAGKSTDEGPAHWDYTGQIESLDSIPPAPTLTVSPARLQVTAGKMVTVTATVTAKDNYDSQPEIKLESITANESLVTGDIVGAALGTNDYQFQLRDVKVPSGTTGRIYTITYSATDASGNKATASATVAVK